MSFRLIVVALPAMALALAGCVVADPAPAPPPVTVTVPMPPPASPPEQPAPQPDGVGDESSRVSESDGSETDGSSQEGSEGQNGYTGESESSGEGNLGAACADPDTFDASVCPEGGVPAPGDTPGLDASERDACLRGTVDQMQCPNAWTTQDEGSGG